MKLELGREDLHNATIWTLFSSNLGNKSYVIESEGEAFVIDPNRLIDPILDLTQSRKLRVKGVVDTHVHNDYVSGALALANELDTDYLLPNVAGLDFHCKHYREGEKLEFGAMELSPVETPGHTWEHHSFILGGVDRGSSKKVAAFTGGSWLAGGAGRTDLVSPADAPKLASAQWKSIHQLSEMLSPNTRIMPTHGSGSYCLESDVVPTDSPTVASELEVNPVLRLTLDEWTETVGKNSRPIPGYFPLMAPANRKGPARFSARLPDPISFEALVELARGTNCTVVDIRDSHRALDNPIQGALRLNSSAPVFTTWFGWLVPRGTPVYFASDDSERVLEAVEDLSQIGQEEIAGYCIVPQDWSRETAFAVRDVLPAELFSNTGRKNVIVDLRHQNERKAGHIRGSVGLPLENLRNSSLGFDDFPLLLHCSGGFRAATATTFFEGSLPEASVEVLLGSFTLDAVGPENVCFRADCREGCHGAGED